MGNLFRVKACRLLLSLLLIAYYAVRVYKTPDLFLPPGDLLSGFHRYLPVAGLLFSVLFAAFSKTFLIPFILLVINIVECLYFKFEFETVLLSSMTLMMVPYARFYFKYLSFEEYVNALRFLFAAAAAGAVLFYRSLFTDQFPGAEVVFSVLLTAGVLMLFFNKTGVKGMILSNSVWVWGFVACLYEEAFKESVFFASVVFSQYFLFFGAVKADRLEFRNLIKSGKTLPVLIPAICFLLLLYFVEIQPDPARNVLSGLLSKLPFKV